MTILVTGATGFIGRHVIRALAETGHEIVATSKTPNMAPDQVFPNMTFVPFDLSERDVDYRKLFGNPEALIHLAWPGLPNYDELYHFESNLNTSYQFIKALALGGGLKFCTVAGTCFEYGLVNGCLSEDMHTAPANPYALAKDTLRRFLWQLKSKVETQFRWVRLFYMHGNGQNPRALLAQLKTAIKNNDKTFNMSPGDQLRDYLPVETVAEYIVRIATHDDFEGIVNCCSGTPVSIRSLVEQYIEKSNASIKVNLGYYPYNEYEPMAFWGDTRKLDMVLKGTKQ